MAEDATPTAQRRFSAVWIGGSVITGLLCGFSAAVFHTAWITPVLVLLGVSVLTILFFRFWWRGVREQVLATRTRTEGVIGLFLSCLVFGFFGFLLVLGVATADITSIDLPQSGWYEIVRLTVGGALFTGFLAPLTCAFGVAIILLRAGNHGDTAETL
jgi:hypothetical protein